MATAGDIPWIDGKAKVYGALEHICPGKHIRSEQWNERTSNYAYISDYECIFPYPLDIDTFCARYTQRNWENLQTAKQIGTSIPILDLAHFTDTCCFHKIQEDGYFIGGPKKINEAYGDQGEAGSDVIKKLSWWSPVFRDVDVASVRERLGRAIQPFLDQYDYQLNIQFATSDAFSKLRKARRYGAYYFQYSIQELLNAYERCFGVRELHYKILGTYRYKQEVMHAVLVCSEANATSFSAYPPVLRPSEDVYNCEVVTRDIDGNWVWRPEATGGTKIQRQQRCFGPLYRRWEHVAFAFHIPDEYDGMIVPDLEHHSHRL